MAAGFGSENYWTRRHSRRAVLQGLAGAAGAAALLSAACSRATSSNSTPNLRITPEMFGAIGNGSHNDAGALQSAIRAAENAGGGTVELNPAANYNLGSTQIMLDGEKPVKIRGAAPAGYDLGAKLTYSGSDWALRSTRTSYPGLADEGQGAYVDLEDLTLQLSGPAYLGGVYGHYLPLRFHGDVWVRGDARIVPRVGTLVQLDPAQNQLDCGFENLHLYEAAFGLVAESDHLTGTFLDCVNCIIAGLKLGISQVAAQVNIQNAHLANSMTAGASGNAILVNYNTYGRIETLHVEGAGITQVAYFNPATAIGNPLFRVGSLEANSLAPNASLMGGQQAPMFERIEVFPGIGWGFNVTQPPVPPANTNIQNLNGTRCMVYLDGNQVDTTVTDWLGNVRTLSYAVDAVTLDHGDKIGFSRPPGTWTWERLN